MIVTFAQQMTVITSGLRQMWRAVWMLVANFPA
jgi:hypothetical protein